MLSKNYKITYIYVIYIVRSICYIHLSYVYNYSTMNNQKMNFTPCRKNTRWWWWREEGAELDSMRINRPPLFFMSSLATVPIEAYTKDYYDIQKNPIKAHFCSLLLPHNIRSVTQYHDNGWSFITTLLCSWKSLVEVAKRKKQSSHPHSSFRGAYSICFMNQSDGDTSADKGVLLLFYVCLDYYCYFVCFFSLSHRF